ncbi:Rha family transcriptional regulator [Bacillus cereus]|uniref:Rha family transcriptional regulator n=1 Tax=Bacillus cereus TaxID=1396 RepID=A0A9X7CT40_BACCE|nr:phage antirepressor KilAC domain-containing protein [Bacillus cereus]PGS84587.1 Rha family transcriptional regulator [Bacillus cereus]
MNQLQILEYKNQRVLITKQLAEAYHCTETHVKQNFNNHKENFEENKHYILLKGAELRVFKRKVDNIYLVPNNVNQLYPWTERGANRHCKILDTDKAWEQFDNLEETYFQSKEQLFKLPATYKEVLIQLIEKEEQKEQLALENAQKEQIIHELKPRADYTDRILKNKRLVTITQIAKDYGMSGQEMNDLLHELGVQYKQSKQWLLYKKYHGKGYTHSETIDIVRSDGRPDVSMTTKWTQKGRLFIYDILKRQRELLPIIERKNQTA